ncbi:hypothetical protein [Treponema zioleckii]|uniref:hypothetical protein n=1 Tax=Treponema zioleckii TaxID=331680 RepID=UPI00168AABAB|nr:hypothetical protein [Treponema zioleckii]
MGNEISTKNNDIVQNFSEETFTVQEIAQKIIDAPKKYLNELECGIPQIAPKKTYYRKLHFRRTVNKKTTVFKGQKLGDYYYYEYCEHYLDNIESSHDGFFIPDLTKFTDSTRDLPVEFGRIYLPEFPFYKKHKQEIEAEVQRIKDKIQKEQQDCIEDLDDLLKELDKYVLANQTIAIETLQEIHNDLKILYNKKSDFFYYEDTIEVLASHFENTYKEAKKNPNLTDIIENRMLSILKTAYLILDYYYLDFGDEPDRKNADERLAKIKAEGDKIRFEVICNENARSLDEAVAKVQEKFSKEKQLDFEQLKTIEDLANYFSSQKDRITQKKSLEPNKVIFESIWKEYSKLDDKSLSAEESLKRILKAFYNFFEKSEEEINDIFTLQENEENTKSLTSKIHELEILVENREQIKIEILQNIEDLLNELAKQKDMIQDKSELENGSVHFDAIFKDCKKRKDFSNSSKLRMQEITNKFSEILPQKQKGFFAKFFGN